MTDDSLTTAERPTPKLRGSKDFQVPIRSVSEITLGVSGLSVFLAVSYNFGYFGRIGFDNLMFFNLVDLLKTSFVLTPIALATFSLGPISMQVERYFRYHASPAASETSANSAVLPKPNSRPPAKITKTLAIILVGSLVISVVSLKLGFMTVAMASLYTTLPAIVRLMYRVDPDFPGPLFYISMGLFLFAQTTFLGFGWADKALHSPNVVLVVRLNNESTTGVLLRSGEKGVLLYSLKNELTTFVTWSDIRNVESTSKASLPVDKYVEAPETNKFIKWFWAR